MRDQREKELKKQLDSDKLRAKIDLHAVRKVSVHAHELQGGVLVLAIRAAFSRHLRVKLSHLYLSLIPLRCRNHAERQNLRDVTHPLRI